MKKKIVISIIVTLILVIGIVSFILFNNSITIKITLDEEEDSIKRSEMILENYSLIAVNKDFVI